MRHFFEMRLLVLQLWILFQMSSAYRLPTAVIPHHYDIQIITNIGDDDKFDFHGTVSIKVTCLEPTQNITLHSKDLEINDTQVSLRDISNDKFADVKLDRLEKETDNDFLVIHLADQLLENHKYEILIPFVGQLRDGLSGYYRSSYLDNTTQTKEWMAVTQFEPTDARRAFPCFDEPAMKATFKISLGRKEKYTSISNMPQLFSEPIEHKPGWIWDRYENSVPMSTYLVAFVVSDFGYKTAQDYTENNVTFNVWSRKDALDQTTFAKDVGPKCLGYYENFFDIPYPLPKQDMIAIPDFSAGAMENWGLITYREAYLLYDNKSSSASSKQSIASVICHELAHQWFGNLVTMKWWTDLWLNEGFATYMASLSVHHLFPQWNSLQEEVVDTLLAVFSFDSLKSSHPVSVPIGNPKEISEIFDTISYDKGSLLIHTMGNFLGENVLKKGVSQYLIANKYGNAEQDDLWESLTNEAHQEGVLRSNLTVKTIMDTWTLQTGYPLITVTRDYEKNSATLKQKRFVRDRIKSPKQATTCWWVPISYKSQKEELINGTLPKLWLSCPSKTQTVSELPDKEEWVLFNIEATGLYKVNYDNHNWHLLSETLNSDSYEEIPTVNRVLLIDDSSDLAWTGDLNYTTHFRILKYLERENEYLPWKAALRNIEVLNRMLRRTSAYGMFKKYVKNLLIPIYNKLGGLGNKEGDNDRLDVVKHKALISAWACKFEISDCVNAAKNMFNSWQLNEDTNPIPKDVRSVVYCTAVRNGGEKEWDFLWKQYNTSNVPTEKKTLLSSLACTREIWLLNRYLEWSINSDSGIRIQDSGTVFVLVGRNDMGYYVARQFLLNKIKDIYKHLGTNSKRLSGYVTAIANQMFSEEDLVEMTMFTTKEKEYLAESRQGIARALENIKLNIQWHKKHYIDIYRLLSEYYEE